MRIEFARGRVNSDKKSDAYFYVSNCGYYANIDRELCTRRPKGRLDYQLIFVAGGYLEIVLNGRKIILEENRCFLFPPGIPQIYGTAGNADTSFYWLHFSGIGSEAILEDCKIPPLMPTEVQRPEDYIVSLKEIVNAIKNGYNETYVSSLAMKLISALNISSKQSKFDAVISRMHYDIRHHIFDGDYAKAAGFSRFHFIRSFKEKYGVTPTAYFNNLRIEKSKFLLLETNMKMYDIASELGFCDQFYFAKLFKKSMGKSPTEYRTSKKI